MIYDSNHKRKLTRESWVRYYSLKDKKLRTYDENEFIRKFDEILNEKI